MRGNSVPVQAPPLDARPAASAAGEAPILPAATARGWRVAAAAGLCVIGFAVSVLLHFPGHMPYDAVVQLHEGRTGVFLSAHPPFMGFFWGLLDRLVPGPALFLVFQEFGLWLALFLFLLFLESPPAFAALAAGFLLLFPPVFALSGVVQKDAPLAHFGLLGYGLLLGAAGRRRRAPVYRTLLCLAALLSLSFGTMFRYQGVVILIPAVIIVAALHLPSRDRRTAAAGFAGVAILALSIAGSVVAGLITIMNRSAVLAADGAGSAFYVRMALIYDLAGISVQVEDADFAVFRRAGIDVPALRREFDKGYDSSRVDQLWHDSDALGLLRDLDLGILKEQWLESVGRHPAAYLRQHLVCWTWLLGFHDVYATWPVFSGISPIPAERVTALGLDASTASWSAVVLRARGFPAGTFLFRHWVYLALSVPVAARLARRPQRYLVPLGMITAGWIYAATFLVLPLAADFRYLYWPMLACLASILCWMAEESFGPRRAASGTT